MNYCTRKRHESKFTDPFATLQVMELGLELSTSEEGPTPGSDTIGWSERGGWS